MKLKVTFDTAAGSITLADEKLGMGWFGLQFYVTSGGRERVAKPVGRAKAQGRGWVWRGDLGGKVQVTLGIAPSPTGKGWVVTPALANRGPRAFAFTGYGFRVADGARGVQAQGRKNNLLVYANSENLRYELLPHCRVTFPFLRPLPPTRTQVGAQASGPIPALFFGQTDSELWLLEGQFTQDRHLLTWHVGLPVAKGQAVDYRSECTWTGGAAETVAAGTSVNLEATLYRVIETPPDRLYAPYMDELARHYRFAGRDSRLDREPVYCTWNFSVFTHITEADCLRRMDVVAKAQRKGYFQIDHGYQKPKEAGGQASADVDGYYPDPEAVWDPVRFPSGPRGFVKACRDRGLRPAIWWSPRVDRKGPISREHPEWLVRNAKGEPIDDVGHLMLDASVPEVRAFIERCIHTIVKVWGFEGIKVDFYTYMFDHADAVFRNGGTGVAWKRWLHRVVRQALGPKGYFLHCISCPLGNPFLALDGCDSYRAGIDIHSGEWEYHVRGSGWLLPAVLATGKTTWHADIDSFMGTPEIPAAERRSRNAFGYITAGLLDFSGPVERLDKQALAEYRRLSERCDQGGGVRCPESEAFYGRPLPRVLIREHAAGSLTRRQFGVAATVAFFNWGETEQAVSLPVSALGGKRRALKLADFWTGKAVACRGDVLSACLPPRGHVMWDVQA